MMKKNDLSWIDNQTERRAITDKLKDIIQVTYFLCEKNQLIPASTDIARAMNISPPTALNRVNKLVALGVLRTHGIRPVLVEPVFHSPVIYQPDTIQEIKRYSKKYGYLPNLKWVSEKSGIPLSTLKKTLDTLITENEAAFIQAIYNYSLMLGYVPDLKLISEKSGIPLSALYRQCSQLEKKGVIYWDKKEPSIPYILKGHGCDLISAPPAAIAYERVSANDAETIALIHNATEALGHKPTMTELSNHLGMTEVHHSLLTVLRRLEKSGVISFDGKKPKRFFICVTDLKEQHASLTREKISLPERITAKQADALNYVRHHILTYGYSPPHRDVVATINVKNNKCIDTLVQRGLLYIDKTTPFYRIRISRGIGMDDVPTDLPALNDMHYRVYDAVIACIRTNAGNPDITIDEIISTRYRKKKCFTCNKQVAALLGIDADELDKYLYVLRDKGFLLGTRDNRYSLSTEYITVAKNIIGVGGPANKVDEK